VTSKHLKSVIHSRRPLHEGFLRVYEYEFEAMRRAVVRAGKPLGPPEEFLPSRPQPRQWFLMVADPSLRMGPPLPSSLSSTT
jgi:hypothetical protein